MSQSVLYKKTCVVITQVKSASRPRVPVPASVYWMAPVGALCALLSQRRGGGGCPRLAAASARPDLSQRPNWRRPSEIDGCHPSSSDGRRRVGYWPPSDPWPRPAGWLAGMAWSSLVRSGLYWQSGLVWSFLVCIDSLVWSGLVCIDLDWFSLVCSGLVWQLPTVRRWRDGRPPWLVDGIGRETGPGVERYSIHRKDPAVVKHLMYRIVLYKGFAVDD